MAHPTSRLVCGLIGVSLLFTACTTKKQETPSLTGPSELSTSIAIAASPDVLAQDGASQSLITITAYDSNGQLLRNLPLRAEIAVDGSITDFGSLSARNIVTDATGRAFVTYTAPPPAAVFVDAGTIVQIRALPTGTNFANDTTRFVSIRLVPPGVIGAPPSPFRPEFTAPGAVVGDTALFSATVTDAAGADVTNQIASYTWSFGDGNTASGRSVSHTYRDAGNFAVSLTIVDALGRRATVTHSVIVGAGANPTATFSMSPPSGATTGQTINFNAAASTAAPGHRITDYSWDFGDGSSAGGVTVAHAYATNGTYTVVLTVTDDAGRKGVATQSPAVGTGGPTASFTFSPSQPSIRQSVTFDASNSRPTAGRTIVGYAWVFDDGSTGSGVTTTHAFNAAGSYAVRLTITDNAGQSASTTQTVIVSGAGPTADFTFLPTSPDVNQLVSFDAFLSRAGTGRTIVSYAWNFGDGAIGSGLQVSHAYSTPSTYTVLLTVTDDVGQTQTASKQVTVGGSGTAIFFYTPNSPGTTSTVFTFDASQSRPGGSASINHYEWTFEGLWNPVLQACSQDAVVFTAVVPTITHQYTTTGTRCITLTVVESSGTRITAFRPITIQ
jgi:PKD repeat protein